MLRTSSGSVECVVVPWGIWHLRGSCRPAPRPDRLTPPRPAQSRLAVLFHRIKFIKQSARSRPASARPAVPGAGVRPARSRRGCAGGTRTARDAAGPSLRPRSQSASRRRRASC
ncbi:unnamed protein product [Plutella xylostella]|uniref:(diamondback moth) hypothetical protein n=1 Tax=Plutella xylostella TaxID=51655 RepID=A0A8S4E7H9_PLUXY|nr:unnamed protein product [Plutella xylostella]